MGAYMLKEFEKEAIRILAKEKLPKSVVEEVVSADVTEIDHTNVGYFLTIQSNLLPKERMVLHEPMIQAISNDFTAGLLIFIENSELTLECHILGDGEIPKDFRETNVTICVI